MIYNNVPVLSPVLKKPHGFPVISWGFALMLRRALTPGLLLSFSLASDLSHPDPQLESGHPTEPNRNHPTPRGQQSHPQLICRELS